VLSRLVQVFLRPRNVRESCFRARAGWPTLGGTTCGGGSQSTRDRNSWSGKVPRSAAFSPRCSEGRSRCPPAAHSMIPFCTPEARKFEPSGCNVFDLSSPLAVITNGRCAPCRARASAGTVCCLPVPRPTHFCEKWSGGRLFPGLFQPVADTKTAALYRGPDLMS